MRRVSSDTAGLRVAGDAQARSVARARGLALALLVLGLGLGGCREDTVVGDAGSRLAVDRTALDLGDVYLGAEAEARVVLSAPGALPVRYQLFLFGDAFGFLAGPAEGLVPANGAVELLVLFRPGRPGEASAALLVQSDAVDDASHTISLVGRGLPPPDCEDGNGCTADRFDPLTGRCVHEAEAVACDDFDQCTTRDVCAEAICLGESRSCDDGDPCTDDLCDPATGCVNPPTRSCDDDNPCTTDICGAEGECRHEALVDGAPCDDFELCTMADICIGGRCVGVDIPDGTMCDDGDPCSKDDQCIAGSCVDPGYTPPGPGDIKYETVLGRLADDAPSNPIVDRDDTVIVGTSTGVAAIDRCGERLWTVGLPVMPRWSGAVSLPGRVSVPSGSLVVDLATDDGRRLSQIDLGGLFGVPTSSTGTTAVQVIELAARASGALVASAVRLDGDRVLEGVVAEIDRGRAVASVFRRLGPLHARRLLVDADEAVVALLADGRLDAGRAGSRLIRFGVDALPDTTWVTTGTVGPASDLGLGPDGEVYWTRGLVRVDRRGGLVGLAPAGGRSPRGAPVIDGDRVLVLRASPDAAGADGDAADELVETSSTGEIRWRRFLGAPAPGASPSLDAAGNVFVVDGRGVLQGLRANGEPALIRELGFTPVHPVATTVSFRSVVIVVGPDRVIGVQGVAPISASTWPRRRRDNLSTGHR